MGSDDKAVITGFICRLCSRMSRFVVHIYGDEGLALQLAQKINVYLPITVNPSDPLPKTVCLQCIDSLEAQHELMEQIKSARQKFARAQFWALQRTRQEEEEPPPENTDLTVPAGSSSRSSAASASNSGTGVRSDAPQQNPELDGDLSI